MNKKVASCLGLFAVLICLLLAVYGLGPGLIGALPSQVRLYLPESVLRAASTPLPTALPAPSLGQAAPPTIIIPTLFSPTAVATQAATPQTATPRPSASPSPTPTATPTATATAVPARTQLSGLSVIPQKFNNCGPANLAINLAYYGHAVDQLEIAASVRPEYDDRNVTPEELVAYVQNQTELQAAVYRGGDLALLKRLLANGYPVVIEKGYEPNSWQGWMGHYLTLIGYDDAEATFTALDTFLGPWDSSGRREGYEALQAQWSHFNYTFYLVYPAEEATAVADLLGPTFADPLTMWQAAAQLAQTETAVDPSNPYAWFNLGSSLTALGQLSGEGSYFQTAVAAFDQARTLGLPWRMLWYQFQPYEAYLADGRVDDVLTLSNAALSSGGGLEEAYYYRGLAYLQQGYPEQARLDFGQALQWNPTFAPAQTALDNLPPR